MSEYQITNSVPVVRADPWWVPAGRAGVLGLLVGLLVATAAGVLLVLACFSLLDVLAVPPLAGLLAGLLVTLVLAWGGFKDAGAVPAGRAATSGRVINPIILRAPGAGDDQADEGMPSKPDVVDGRAVLYRFLSRAYLVGLSRSVWVGRKVPKAVRVSRLQYDTFCTSLGRSGVAADDGKGWRLVVPIEQAMKACGLVSLWIADGRAGGPAGGRDTSQDGRPVLRLVGKGG